MFSVERPAPDAAAGPARVFIKRDDQDPMSSGHLSDGGRSLTRRSRVRRKNSRRDDDSSSGLFSTSGDISSGQLFVKIPLTDARSSTSPRSAGVPEPGIPPRPARSPWRPQPSTTSGDFQRGIELPTTRPRTLSSGAVTSHPVVDDERGRETCSESGRNGRGQRSRGLSLPRHAFRTDSLSDSSEQFSPLTPNAFNDIPPMPFFAQNRRFRHQPRDSGVTHQSTASSSIYPKSSSTDDSYPSLHSLPANDVDDIHIITVDPEDNPHVHELHEMDADDVSYRLRLLMQNNYYLPPAHSKPFSEYPSSETAKKSPLKSSSPMFFDIFKAVKKKSAASEPMAPSAPILRTTSDSSTLSGLIRPQQPARPSQHLHAVAMPTQPRQEAKKGRVVVVRERMEDIEIVAKQVELDLKWREAERRRNATDSSPSEDVHDGVVDPTDSVDLPPVSANCFFGPQTSLLNGIGVEASVGAALLADHLPPSSPGNWSVDSEDEAWRKAILHAAVNHSLNNSPAATSAGSDSSPSRFINVSTSPSPASPSALGPLLTASSPVPSAPRAISGTAKGNGDALGALGAPNTNNDSLCVTRKKRELGQRILSCIIDEAEMDNAVPSLLVHEIPSIMGVERGRRPSISIEKSHSLRIATAGNFVPIRASSPTVPTTPLLPPPRRPNMTPAHSSDSPAGNGQRQSEGPFVNDTRCLQIAQEDVSLRLSDSYESHISGALGEVTPPTSQNKSVLLSAVKAGPCGLISAMGSVESITSGSHYSDGDRDSNDFHTPREHTLASTFTASRPSFAVESVPRGSSDNFLPSPTTSAFRYAFDRSPYSGSSPAHSVANTLGGGSRVPSQMSEIDDARFTAVSPPPRVSSSLAHTVLHPPPSRRVNPISERFPLAQGEDDEFHTPTGGIHSLLGVTGFPDGGSGTYPSSPISFFDTVELQSREEEEETCTEDEGEQDSDTESAADAADGYQSDSAGMVIVAPPSDSVHNITRDPKQPLGSFTRLGNSSSPQLASGSSQSGYNELDSRRAIVNVPKSDAPLSASWYKKQGKRREQPLPPCVSESTLDRIKHGASASPGDGKKRPATARSRVEQRPWTGNKPKPGLGVQSWRDEQSRHDQSMRRLDGMLIQHMEREKEVLRRITTTLSKSS